MAQNALFSEDIHDALADVVRALGGSKAVGGALRPDLPAMQAARWVLDCLNRDRREKFDPDQILWLLREGRKAGCHSAMNFLCDEAGYVRPSPMEPQDEAAQLMRQYVEAVQTLKRLSDKGERLGLRVA
jgi:hypothetical protein